MGVFVWPSEEGNREGLMVSADTYATAFYEVLEMLDDSQQLAVKCAVLRLCKRYSFCEK